MSDKMSQSQFVEHCDSVIYDVPTTYTKTISILTTSASACTWRYKLIDNFVWEEECKFATNSSDFHCMVISCRSVVESEAEDVDDEIGVFGSFGAAQKRN